MFAPDCFWYRRLPRDAPIDPDSSTYVTSLVSQFAALGGNFNFRTFALSIFWANENTPRQQVWLDTPDGNRPKLRAALASVPIPLELRASGPFPGDQIACICCPHSDGTLEYYDFHRLAQFEVDGPNPPVSGCTTQNNPGWHCDNAVAIKDLRVNPGWARDSDWPGGMDSGDQWGNSGSKLLLYPMVITVAEARRGYIPHALRLDMPKDGHRDTYRWPALGSDATGTDSSLPETGTRFRLPPDDDLSDVADPFTKVICAAIRDFGLILTDGTGIPGTVALKCETQATVRGSQAFRPDAWKGPKDQFGSHGAILTDSTNHLIRQIPFDRLQVVDASYRPSSIAPGLGKGS
jgi:hypothetical protein